MSHDPRTRQTFYSTVKPTVFEDVSCEDDDCEMYANGWITKVPAVGPQALYIRQESGREFTEELHGDQAWFRFTPGQRCFRQHRIAVTPPTLLHFPRGDVGAPDVQRAIRNRETWRPSDWLEKLHEGTERAAELRQRG